MTTDSKRPFSYEASILLRDDFPLVTGAVDGGNDPDRGFFIRTHRAFEIWFQEIIEDLRFALDQLGGGDVAESDVPRITHHVQRAAKTFELLQHHLPLLETLQTASFYSFRQELFGGSGGDSYRFKIVEWMMGFLDEALFEYAGERSRQFHPGEEREQDPAYLSLNQYRHAYGYGAGEPAEAPRKPDVMAGGLAASRARDPASPMVRAVDDAWQRHVVGPEPRTLHSALLRWLERTPLPGLSPDRAARGAHFRTEFLRVYRAACDGDLAILQERGLLRVPREQRDRLTIDQYRAAVHDRQVRRAEWFLGDPARRAVVFIQQFAAHPLLAWPAALLEAFLALDEAMADWRERHVQMVSHVIGGGRVSTMGAEESGLPFLRSTLAKRAFPEIWDGRSFFLSEGETDQVYGAPAAPRRWPALFDEFRLVSEVPELVRAPKPRET